MALNMKPDCERCSRTLTGNHAYICSYECTFCADCSEAMQHRCPNCNGELVRRPRRPESPTDRS